jgi:uncharacterized lipoprotein YddW (UPF0748 family)
LKTPEQITQLVAEARAARFNALVVQVRRRGDALYNGSPFEPRATDSRLAPPPFDPLADLLAKAHDLSTGPRLEIHAWIVTYNIWNQQSTPPADARHPYNLHPDWLTRNDAGATWDGNNYAFDPGHPDVQRHTFNVAMDIISRYDIDGLNLDYIRYNGYIWGYNPVAVARFNARYGRTGQPAPTDELWRQFRRDQVTALVRKLYLSAAALKPHLKLSADTITWAPSVTTASAWTNSARAYGEVLQDWRSWMQEGILDLNMPMAYFRHTERAADYAAWNTFTKDHRYNRQAAIGPGIYLNSISNSLVQIRQTRAATPAGHRADGVVCYSYRVTNDEGAPRATFLEALTRPGRYDAVSPPVFAERAEPPAMPWKTTPTRGHLKGFILAAGQAQPVDGPSVSLTGASSRSAASDATGFYGAVDVLPGQYLLTAQAPGLGKARTNVVITAGVVTTADLVLTTNDITPPVITYLLLSSVADTAVAMRWATDEPADATVEFGLTHEYGLTSRTGARALGHTAVLSNLLPATLYHYRMKVSDAAGNLAVSADATFLTNPEGVISDLILDNPHATVVGAWNTGLGTSDKYGPDYRYRAQGGGAGYLQFTPTLLRAGLYDVFEWHPAGVNRTTNAPHEVRYFGDSRTVWINQETNGGRWNLMGRFPFAAGTEGYVRVTDAIPEPPPSNMVLADAIRFAYAAPLAAPQIATHPADQSARAGSQAAFEVAATGAPSPSYQWQFNAQPLAGATNSQLSIAPVREDHAGEYSVVVSNLLGTVTSSPATLRVIPLHPLRFLSVSLLTDRRVRLQIIGEPGATVELQRSTDLAEWDRFTSLVLTDGAGEFTDEPLTNQSQRFYRLRSAEPEHVR